MTYSTTNAIRDALEVVVTGLTPKGDRLGRNKFRKASTAEGWDKKPDSDIDREFSIETVNRGRPTMFGATSEIDYTGNFELTIGHAFSGNRKQGERRRDTDLFQITANLEKKANYPTGCMLIRATGWNSRELNDFWITTISFEIYFTLVAP